MSEYWKCYCGKCQIPKNRECPNCGRSQYESIRDQKRYRNDAPPEMYGR